MTSLSPVRIVDSHTGGEPTRVVVSGGPDLGSGDLAARRRRFREQHDEFRRAVVNEPRGSDIIVGALLCEPVDPNCAAGVVFFNNVDVLHMCGHGAIGVAVTLAHLGRIGVGSHRLETPVGVVGFEFHGEGRVTIENVSSYRLAKDVAVDVPAHGVVKGDVVWGGNWFFLSDNHGQTIDASRIPQLVDFTRRLRQAIERGGVTGKDGALIDHFELFGPPKNPAANCQNFVLCPGGAYDRSPCGTGTSAKLACLHDDGKLAPGETWRQESIIGSVFEGSYRLADGQCVPSVTGEAFITAEATLLFDPRDPFRSGIPS